MHKGWIGIVAGAVAAAIVAMPAAAQERRSKDLQFADIGKVESWRPGGARLIYIRDGKEQWYRVGLLEPCMDLFPGKEPTFITLTDTQGQRYSAVVIERRQCTVTELAKLDAPPPREPYVPPKPSAPAKPSGKAPPAK
jgi:hypothetical protein